MSAESNDGWKLAVKVTLASTGKNRKSDMTRSHEAAKENGPVEGEELAGGNGGWNLTVKVTMGKNKESKNKGSRDATKQNGPVEGEETLAAAGASADAKESPPDECRKTCDVQDIFYHGQDVQFQLEIDGGSDGVTMEIVTNGQTASFGSTDHAQKTEEADMQAVGGNESVSMEVTTEEQVTSQDRTVRAGQSGGEDLESDDEEGDVSLKLATSGQVASLDTAACGLLSKGEDPIELVEVIGDLFSCPATDAMAHCVSEDLVMDKGITVRFKKEFLGTDDMKAQAKKVGDVAMLYRQGKFVYYLITKACYFHKPTYQTLKSSLTAMKNHMVEHKVTHLSMPTIGCGQDGLVWDIVADIIKDVFHGTGIQITIYHYDGM